MLSSCINRLSRLSIGNQGGVVTRSFFASSGSPVGALATTATNRSCLSGNNSYTNNQQQQQPPPQQLQTRSKHSERQIKRLFRQHPAKIRVEASIGLDRTPEPLDPPQFKPVFEPTFLPNGWSAPPGTDVSIPEYPFQVKRTKNKPSDAIGFLPVYSNFRKNGAATTRIKKVTGDRDLFLKELRSNLELPAPKNGDSRLDPIRIRVGGTIEVKGNRTREIKEWLAGLGF